MDTAGFREIRIVALTPGGAALARRILRGLDGATLWLPKRLVKGGMCSKSFERLESVIGDAFRNKEDLVCIMAAGIVVRHAAPFLQGKAFDPAVVVLDEKGEFAISLLSGHLGGANELSRRVASLIGATPVITTGTDVQGLPAFDSIARERGLIIENLEAVRQVHMALLEGRIVRIVDPGGLVEDVLTGYPEAALEESNLEEAISSKDSTVYIGSEEGDWPRHWLLLRPRELVAGVGCNRGTPSTEIIGLIRDIFREAHLSLLSIRALATIEAKRHENGLIQAAKELKVELVWFSTEELMKVTVPHPSAMVARHMGTASVCEAAALKAARTDRLIVAKRKSTNATLAVARAQLQ